MPRGVYDRKNHRMFTDEMNEYLTEHYPHDTNAEIIQQMVELFGIELNKNQLIHWAKRHGLKKTDEAMLKTRRTVADSNRIYTDEMLEFMRSFIPGHVYPEFADEFERRFGWRPSRTQYKNSCVKYCIKSGVKGYGCFGKGHKPSNRGKKWDDFMSPEAQQRVRDAGNLFRRGQKSANAYHKLLDMRLDAKDNRWYIYVNPRNAKYTSQRWITHAQFVWMQANGRDFPPNCKCIHCNHDTSDDRPENLMAVPNDVCAVINNDKTGMEYWDRDSLRLATLHAKMTMTARQKQRDVPRRCEVCGRKFRVDEGRYYYAERVRVCAECVSQGKRAPMKKRKSKGKARQGNEQGRQNGRETGHREQGQGEVWP